MCACACAGHVHAILLSIVPSPPSTIPHPTRLSPDQEIDDFAVAQSTPLPECIAGCEGDTVRRPSFTVPTFIQHSHRFCKRMPSSLVQGGDTYAEGFGITILIPKNFRHESFEAEEAAKELTIKAKAAEAKAEAKDEPKEAEQTTKKSAAAKLAGTKQKIKKHAAAAKVAPASKPVTASPPCYALCGRLTDPVLT